jgi:hypothetical protein
VAKTIRKVNPKTAAYAKRVLADVGRSGNSQDYNERTARHAPLLLAGKRHFRSDKCSSAQIDSEGGYKLDTWSECPSKGNTIEARRKERQAGRILTARQLSE